MNYKQLVKTAGYKDEQAEYIARKLADRKVPESQLNSLSQYFPGTTELGGVDIYELSVALYAAVDKMQHTAEKKAVVKDGE